MKTPEEVAAEVVGHYEDRRYIKGRTLTKRVAEAIAERDKRADALAEALNATVRYLDERGLVGAKTDALRKTISAALAAYDAEAK